MLIQILGTVLLLALALLFGSQSMRGLKTKRITSRRGSKHKSERPFAYWFSIFVYSILSIGFAIMAVKTALGWMVLSPEASEALSVKEPDKRLEFHHSRIQDCDHLPERFDHIICMGATHAFGDLGEALTNTLKSLARWFKPGSKALIGEGYWKREPAPSYLKFLKTRREQLRSLNDSLQHVREHGFQVCARHLSEGAEWDSFEEAFWRAAQLEAADNPRDPLIQEKFDRRRQWYDNYHRWGRSTMGFLSMVLSR